MRRITSALFAAVGLTAGLGQVALAADLPQRPASVPLPVIAPAPTWTGCYVGGNIGGAFGHASVSLAGPSGNSGTVTGDDSGFAGGGQIGCDYDFGGGWVIGFRDMYDWTSNSSSGTFQSIAFPGFGERQLQESMVRYPDRPHRLRLPARLVALRSGWRRLGPDNYERSRRWFSNWPDLQY